MKISGSSSLELVELGLEGRRALITGATSGIGLACARALAAEGVDLAVTGREMSSVKKVTKDLRSSYRVEVTSHCCDLGNERHQDSLAEVVGPVDIVINNAGTVPAGNLAELDRQSWHDGWQAKLFGYINLCRLFMEPMTARGSGVILNVIGAMPPASAEMYLARSTAHAALEVFTRQLGGTSTTTGVRVLGVHPGITLTESLEQQLRQQALAMFDNPELWEDLLPAEPAPATAEQIADVVTFLVSDRAGYISGTTILVDGGLAALG